MGPGTREVHVGVDLVILLEKAVYMAGKVKNLLSRMLNLGLNTLTRLVRGKYKISLEHLLVQKVKKH